MATEPNVTVIGVYRLAVTSELIDATLEQIHGYVPEGDDRAELEPYCSDLVNGVALVEVLVKNRDERFRVDDFGQVVAGQDPGQRQAPWLETYLTLDGKQRLIDNRYLPDTPRDDELRITFFLHFWEPGIPLATSYGDVGCPSVSEMPERLTRLAPHEPPD
jgi:hypothetical protein